MSEPYRDGADIYINHSPVKSDLRDQLLAMPLDERSDCLAELTRARIASALNRDESEITFHVTFDAFNQDGQKPIYEILKELVQENLGRPFHRWEFSFPPRGVEELNTIARLAKYLAKDMELQAPEGGYTDPYEGGNWLWGLPLPVSEGIKRNRSMVFVLSTARSGSTLLRVMLDGHPLLFCPPELYLLPFDSMAERRDKITHLGYHWMLLGFNTALSILQQQNPGWTVPSLDELEADDVPIHQVYGMIQELIGERLLVDKTPPYASHPAWLHRAEGLFHEAKYIFLVRHPFAVIESYVRMRFPSRLLGNHWLYWDENPWLNAEKHWAVLNHHVLEFLKGIEAERQHRVYYEDLVTEPQATLNGICSFLGIPFNEAILNPYLRGNTDYELGDPNLRNHNSVDPGLATAWQKKRPPQQLSDFTRRIADELGYRYPLA